MSDSPQPTSPIDTATLDAIRSLTVDVRRVIEGLQGGGHASLHLGASVEFDEHKRYYPGDNTRNLDWKVLARTDRLFVKQHQREVTLRCLLLLDSSPSMNYTGSRAARSKFQYARLLAAALAHIIVRQGDEAGLELFADRVLDFLPPRRSPDYLQVLTAQLAGATTAPKGATAFTPALTYAAEHAGRRAMIVLISDLWGIDHEGEMALARLAAMGNDVVLFRVLSPDEADFPFREPTTFADSETAVQLDVDPSLIREDYRVAAARLEERWHRFCGDKGIDYVSVLTTAAPEQVLADFAARRHRGGGRR